MLLRPGNVILLFFACTCLAPLGGQPVVEEGIIDLRNYNFNEDGIVSLEGAWEFYWGQLVDPLSVQRGAGQYAEVPEAWKNLSEEVEGIQAKGYGTYIVRILLPRNTQQLALRFTEVFSASGYYLNGKNIGFNGFPGANRFQSTFGYAPTMYVFTPVSSEVTLLVHVSNFEHRSGGIRGSVELGTSVQIMNDIANKQYRDFFLLGAFLIIGFYFVGLYLIRNEFYKQFFAMICLVMSFRIFIHTETNFVDSLLSNGSTRLRLEYLSFDFLVPFFLLMIRYLFPNDFPVKLGRVLLWFCAFMILLVIFTPVSLFSEAYMYYMYLVLFVLAVILFTLIRACIRGRSYAVPLTIGLGIVTIGAVNDMLHVADVIHTGYVTHYTMFSYLFIYAIVFSSKNNRDFLLAEKLFAENRLYRENLEELVRKRTGEVEEKSEELKQQQEKLKERNQVLQKEVNVRNKFLNIIGHDVRGPVGYIQQVLELLADGRLKKKDADEMIRMAAESSVSVMNLLENLLFWGRTQTGDIKNMPIRFKFEELVYEITDLFALSSVEKSITLRFNIPKDLKVHADIDHVRLILRNLVSNAIKYTRPGGSILVSAAISQKPGEAEIEVEDNGIGMSEEEVALLFSPNDVKFTPGTRDEKGTGMGLRLCKELIELNGGSISVKSQKNEGSVFRFTLPIV